MSRDGNWGTENAISREKGIAEEEERKTKEEQKSSRDQGGQQVDRDVAGNRELGFCSTFVVEN